MFAVERAAAGATAAGNNTVTRRRLDVVDGALVPDNQTFTLHSLPGSSRTIFLDFDGATLTETIWNSIASLDFIRAVEFNLDGVAGFSSAELQEARNLKCHHRQSRA